jgi:hypothetical protein
MIILLYFIKDLKIAKRIKTWLQVRNISKFETNINEFAPFWNLFLGSISVSVMAGYSIFAHSRPAYGGPPRLLPLYINKYFFGLSAKESAQILYPAIYCCLWIHG